MHRDQINQKGIHRRYMVIPIFKIHMHIQHRQRVYLMWDTHKRPTHTMYVDTTCDSNAKYTKLHEHKEPAYKIYEGYFAIVSAHKIQTTQFIYTMHLLVQSTQDTAHTHKNIRTQYIRNVHVLRCIALPPEL